MARLLCGLVEGSECCKHSQYSLNGLEIEIAEARAGERQPRPLLTFSLKRVPPETEARVQ
jgi:hypothetical protein